MFWGFIAIILGVAAGGLIVSQRKGEVELEEEQEEPAEARRAA